MHFLLFLLVAGAVGFASAKTINIAAADYTFTPGTSTADKGDILNFHFYPHQHNVVQGVFNKPCTPLANGFFSGTIAAPSGPANATFSVEVKDDQPIWFYCSVGKHCQRGMVGVINAPKDQTLDAYQSGAAKAADNITPEVPAGNGGTLTTGVAAPSTSLPNPSSPFPLNPFPWTGSWPPPHSATSGANPTSTDKSVTTSTTTVRATDSSTTATPTSKPHTSASHSATATPSSGATSRFQLPVALALVAAAFAVL